MRISTYPKLKPISSGMNPLPQLSPKDKISVNTELPQWSSNSTVDSYCSTVAMDTIYDAPEEDLGDERSKKRRKGSEASESGPIPKASLLLRRQSSNSGQWKGVRWKPVLEDKGGRRHSACSASLCVECQRCLALQAQHHRRNTEPAASSSSSSLNNKPVPTPSELPPFAFTTGKIQTNSLPNLPVSRDPSPPPK